MTRERRKAVLAFAGFSYLLFGSDRLHLEIRPIKGIFHPISASVFPVLRNNKDSHGRRFHKRQYPRFPYNCKTAFAAAPYPHGCPVGMTRDFLSIFGQCKRRRWMPYREKSLSSAQVQSSIPQDEAVWEKAKASRSMMEGVSAAAHSFPCVPKKDNNQKSWIRTFLPCPSMRLPSVQKHEYGIPPDKHDLRLQDHNAKSPVAGQAVRIIAKKFEATALSPGVQVPNRFHMALR